jgi:hypothetical protein
VLFFIAVDVLFCCCCVVAVAVAVHNSRSALDSAFRLLRLYSYLRTALS